MLPFAIRCIARPGLPQERRQRLAALWHAVLPLGSSHARPLRGAVLGVPGEPHLTSPTAPSAPSPEIPASSPFHLLQLPFSCHESTRVANISRSPTLSRTVSEPAGPPPILYTSHSSSDLGSSKPYLPPNPAVSVSPPFTSLHSSSAPVSSSSSSSALPTKQTRRRRIYRRVETRTTASSRRSARVRRTSPRLVCSFPQCLPSPHVVSSRRSIETGPVKSAALANQPYIHSRLSCFIPIWTALDWAALDLPLLDSIEL